MKNGHVQLASAPALAYRAQAHLLEAAQVDRLVADQCVDSIVSAADLIARAFRTGGKLLLCGNGGSAADCQHLAAEFVNRLTSEFERPGLPAVALTTDTSFLTAFSNDYGFADVFVRQVDTLGKPGDALIAISTSGESANVLRATHAARARQISTIGLTGPIGRLACTVDVAIRVPSTCPQHIQEAHLAIEHILCDLVEQSLLATPGVNGGLSRDHQ